MPSSYRSHVLIPDGLRGSHTARAKRPGSAEILQVRVAEASVPFDVAAEETR